MLFGSILSLIYKINLFGDVCSEEFTRINRKLLTKIKKISHFVPRLKNEGLCLQITLGDDNHYFRGDKHWYQNIRIRYSLLASLGFDLLITLVCYKKNINLENYLNLLNHLPLQISIIEEICKYLGKSIKTKDDLWLL